MPWYAHWFDRDEYELVYQNRDEEEAERLVDLLERTARPAPEAKILDVGCGRGRHARTLARRGYCVTGIDLSERALMQARQRAEEEAIPPERLRFLQRDMRGPLGDSCYDGVVNLFTAFGYFDDEEDHLRALCSMTTALKPGGWLFQDFLNAPYAASHLVPIDSRIEDGVEILQRRWVEDGRINKEITLYDDGAPRHFTESVRLLTLDDFARLYETAGLTLQHTFGDYDGGPSSETAPRLILYAQRLARGC